MEKPEKMSPSLEVQNQNLFDIKETLKQLKKACDDNNYEQQVRAYIELGNHYFSKKHDHINAIAIYNFAIAICEDVYRNLQFRHCSLQLTQEVIKKIKIAETKFLCDITGRQIKASDYKLDKAHKLYLEGIRKEARAQRKKYEFLSKIIKLDKQAVKKQNNKGNLEEYLHNEDILNQLELSIKRIHQDISQKMRDFIEMLIDECMVTIGSAPCEYAVICFGSYARDEATPYSDLEFAILIEDMIHVEYFRNLTKYLHIKILNLSETTPRMQNIKELEMAGLLASNCKHNPTKRGISFDGLNIDGRIIPLGNMPFIKIDKIEEANRYELIQTGISMADYMSEKWLIDNPHLFSVLNTFKVLSSSKRGNILVDVFKKKLNSNLEISNNKFEYATLRQRAANNLLQEACDKFEPATIKKSTTYGKHFEIKYDIYRLPILVIQYLALYFGIEMGSTFSNLEQLCDKGHISKNTKIYLCILIEDILQLRLIMYLQKDEQCNLLEPDVENKNFNLKSILTINETQVTPIYNYLFTLLEYASEFACTKGTNNLFLKEECFIDSIASSELISLVRQGKNIEVIEYCLKLLNINERSDESNDKKVSTSVMSHTYMAKASLNMGHIQDAKDHYEKALAFDSGDPALYSGIAEIYEAESLYDQAKSCHQKAIALAEEDVNKYKHLLPYLYSGYGIFLNDQHDFFEAIKYHKQAIDCFIKINPHGNYSIISFKHNLALTYNEMGNYEEAKDIFEDITKKIVYKRGDLGNLNIRPLCNLAISYKNIGRYSDAISVLKRAIDCIVFEEDETSYILENINIYNELCLIYSEMGEVTEAQEYAKKLLDFAESCINIRFKAIAYSAYGMVQLKINNYNLANTYLDNAISLYKEIDTVSVRSKVELSILYDNLGISYLRTITNKNNENYKTNNEILKKVNALLMDSKISFEKYYKLSPCNKYKWFQAVNANRIAELFAAEDKIFDAIEEDKKSIKLAKDVLSGRLHPHLCIVYTNLAEHYKIACRLINKSENVYLYMKTYLEALRINIQLSNTVFILNNRTKLLTEIALFLFRIRYLQEVEIYLEKASLVSMECLELYPKNKETLRYKEIINEIRNNIKKYKYSRKEAIFAINHDLWKELADGCKQYLYISSADNSQHNRNVFNNDQQIKPSI